MELCCQMVQVTQKMFQSTGHDSGVQENSIFGICMGHQLFAMANWANLQDEIWSPWFNQRYVKLLQDA